MNRQAKAGAASAACMADDLLLHAGAGLAKEELATLAILAEDDDPTAEENYPPLYLMAEAAWLAYEEARVSYHVLTNPDYGWVKEKEKKPSVIVLDFVSVNYKETSGELRWLIPTALDGENVLHTALASLGVPMSFKCIIVGIPKVMALLAPCRLYQPFSLCANEAQWLIGNHCFIPLRWRKEKENPLDTQLVLFAKGNAVILAFRCPTCLEEYKQSYLQGLHAQLHCTQLPQRAIS